MTTKEEESMNTPLRLHTVDWIEANVVTAEMIDKAIKQSPMSKTAALDPYAVSLRRRNARRNIAIGLKAGSYGW